jgi:hypothetical protein
MQHLTGIAGGQLGKMCSKGVGHDGLPPAAHLYIDLSHTIHDGLVTYKGLPAPVIGYCHRSTFTAAAACTNREPSRAPRRSVD